MYTNGHRAGVFKQANKKFKSGRHRTKGEINRDTKGRKQTSKPQRGPGGKLVKLLSRADRLSLRKQARQRNASIIDEQRAAAGGANRAPHLVTILSLDHELLAGELVERLLTADEAAVVSRAEHSNVVYMNVPRYKTRYGFMCPSLKSTEILLDCLRVSDALMIIWPTDVEEIESHRTLLELLLAHGIPEIMHVTVGLPPPGKQREQARKIIQRSIEKWHSAKTPSIYSADTNSDQMQILRQLSTVRKQRKVEKFLRPQVLVDEIATLDANEVDRSATLTLTGYVREAPLNVNKLIYIHGLGERQIERIIINPDPRSIRSNRQAMETDSIATLEHDPSKRESLQAEVDVDPMDTEQPEPFEPGEDIFEAPKEKKRVPEGTSEYQAAWILDEEDGEEHDDDEDDEEMLNVSADVEEKDEDEEAMDEASDEDEAQDEQMSDARGTVRFGNTSDDDEMVEVHEIENFRQSKEDDELKWADIVDLPPDVEARVRMQKYRGLKSFRTSPWDPKENLPPNYARIYKFGTFKHTKKLAALEYKHDFADEVAADVATPGTYVTICIANVPLTLIESLQASQPPIVVTGMLKHEQKFTLMNVMLRKSSAYDLVVKNKQRLSLCIGYRRFDVEPIFSQHTNGDKFKMERIMPDEAAFIASFYAPVMFGAAPVLAFSPETAANTPELIASGCVGEPNPDRIVLKRAILRGNVYKQMNKAAVVRFMFFNKMDIDWFKCVELSTGGGNVGHIKNSIGTHGAMKCVFNLPLKKQDEVRMALYKRVFPCWSYTPRGLDATTT